MAKYRKKPIVIEAIENKGRINGEELREFMDLSVEHFYQYPGGQIPIPTLEGMMIADVGDFVIKGINGEFYPCKPDIFEQSYTKEIE